MNAPRRRTTRANTVAVASRSKGRPVGSPTKDYAAGESQPSNCPACKSTNSHVLKKMTELPQLGIHNGQPFNRKVLHRVKCDDCPRVRNDTTYLFVPPIVAE